MGFVSRWGKHLKDSKMVNELTETEICDVFFIIFWKGWKKCSTCTLGVHSFGKKMVLVASRTVSYQNHVVRKFDGETQKLTAQELIWIAGKKKSSL